MDRLFRTICSLTALALLGTVLEMLLPDGPMRKGMDLIIGLTLALGILALLPLNAV